MFESHLQEQAPDERQTEKDKDDGEVKDEQTLGKDPKSWTAFCVECTCLALSGDLRPVKFDSVQGPFQQQRKYQKHCEQTLFRANLKNHDEIRTSSTTQSQKRTRSRRWRTQTWSPQKRQRPGKLFFDIPVATESPRETGCK